MSVNKPVVSVVTPFRDTAPYLAECIDSVLSQSYGDYEYILSDNCSTDGSTEIAEKYARRDSRIRFIRQPKVLSQVEHYNRILLEISDNSLYCKIAQGDDCLFPECLRLMVQAFAQSELIGLVSSYDVKANIIRGSGFPYPTRMLTGDEAVRLYLRHKVFPFGSPNTVMYRASLVRDRYPFYKESLLHEDTEKCIEILKEWSFGFVHQVLSFMRTDNVNESVSAKACSFKPNELDRYIIVKRYAASFLEPEEADSTRKVAKGEYYRCLAGEALRFRESEFWQYHKGGLNTVGERFDWLYLTKEIGRALLVMSVNPGNLAMRGLRFLNRGWRSRHEAAVNNSRQAVAALRVTEPGAGSQLADAKSGHR